MVLFDSRDVLPTYSFQRPNLTSNIILVLRVLWMKLIVQIEDFLEFFHYDKAETHTALFFFAIIC